MQIAFISHAVLSAYLSHHETMRLRITSGCCDADGCGRWGIEAVLWEKNRFHVDLSAIDNLVDFKNSKLSILL